MIQPVLGFIIYGVHKDGLKDPMGVPFIDSQIVKNAKAALKKSGLKLVEHDLVVASKDEAWAAMRKMKLNDEVDGVVLFSGTWVWAAHLAAAVRDYAATGKGLLLWTHPASQAWRPVGGLALHAALRGIGVGTRFVTGAEAGREPVTNFAGLAGR